MSVCTEDKKFCSNIHTDTDITSHTQQSIQINNSERSDLLNTLLSHIPTTTGTSSPAPHWSLHHGQHCLYVHLTVSSSPHSRGTPGPGSLRSWWSACWGGRGRSPLRRCPGCPSKQQTVSPPDCPVRPTWWWRGISCLRSSGLVLYRWLKEEGSSAMFSFRDSFLHTLTTGSETPSPSLSRSSILPQKSLYI